jgi:hypothetical protein
MKIRSQIRIASLMALFTLAFAAKVNAQSVNPCDNAEHLPSYFFEVPIGPQGTWTAVPMPDFLQDNDPQVPVMVVGAGGIQGPKDRRGMRLGCGTLRNLSEQSVVAVRLRWILARLQDRQAIAQQGYTHDTVLVVGATPRIELSIAKGGQRKTDFSLINFVEVTRSLAKDGVLSGDYVLIVGVEEVQFEDGSVWKAARL